MTRLCGDCALFSQAQHSQFMSLHWNEWPFLRPKTRCRKCALGTVWHENALGSASVSAELMVLSSHRLNEQVVLLHSAQMRSDLSLERAQHLPLARSLQHSPRPMLWSPLTYPLAHSSLLPWSPHLGQPHHLSSHRPDPWQYPYPLSPACHPLLTNHLVHCSSLLPELGLPIPVCPCTAPEVTLLLPCSEHLPWLPSALRVRAPWPGPRGFLPLLRSG